MTIEIAENAGYCFGVKRAIQLAEDAAEKYGEVFTLGELIHNERAIEELDKKVVHAVSSIQDAVASR